jgi:hypothetical protein
MCVACCALLNSVGLTGLNYQITHTFTRQNWASWSSGQLNQVNLTAHNSRLTFDTGWNLLRVYLLRDKCLDHLPGAIGLRPGLGDPLVLAAFE